MTGTLMGRRDVANLNVRKSEEDNVEPGARNDDAIEVESTRASEPPLPAEQELATRRGSVFQSFAAREPGKPEVELCTNARASLGG